ncbi:hypothetical protein ACFLTO_04080 [Chloroflexota bacterium]
MKKPLSLLSVSLVVSLLITLFSLPVPALADDELTAPATDFGTTSPYNGSGYDDTGIDAMVDVTIGDKILVVATYEVKQTAQSTDAFHRIALHLDEESTNSGEFRRELSANKADDRGIGSIVHIFTAGSTGELTYKLQHHSSGKNIITTGTIVAVPLSTGAGTLRSEEMQVTEPVAVNATGTWLPVTGSNSTTGIETRMASHLYVAACIESVKPLGGDETGMWRLQYQKDGGDWTGLGYPVSRYLSSGDIGMISLVGLLQNQEAATYKFRLCHQSTGTNLETTVANIVSIGLEDGVGYLDTTQGYTEGPTTTSNDTLASVATTGITPYVTTQMFVHAQYEMFATPEILDPEYNVSVNGSKLASQVQQRYISGAGDLGSGASVGLTTDLTQNTLYTLDLNHASDGSNTLSTSDAYVVGIMLGYATAQPPVPEWPTIILVSVGMAAIVLYAWFRRPKTAAQSA